MFSTLNLKLSMNTFKTWRMVYGRATLNFASSP